MKLEEIIEGYSYIVDAPGCTRKTERWKLKEKKQSNGEWYVEMRGNYTPHIRSFTLDQVIEMDRKEAKKMAESVISESVELVGLIQGKEMWIERIDNWPLQKKRGRKRNSEKLVEPE